MSFLHDLEVTLVQTLDEANEMARWLGERRPVLGVDTETEGLDWWRQKLRLVQLGDEKRAFVVPWEGWGGLIAELLPQYQGRMSAHNWKFDGHFLEQHGVKIDPSKVDDTRLMVHCVDTSLPAALKPLTVRLFGPEAAAGQDLLNAAKKKQGWGWHDVPVDYEGYWAYAGADASLTAATCVELDRRLDHAGTRGVYDLELECMGALIRMEARGIRVDLGECAHRRKAALEEADHLREKLRGQWGILNPDSSQQVADALQREGAEVYKRTPSGRPSTDEESLTNTDHPIAGLTLAMRKAAKVAGSYFETFEELADGDILHPSINQVEARTGRMSVTRPALQTLPRGGYVRSAFRAREGNKLVLMDYKQMEMRVFAHYALEPTMLEAIDRDEDLHDFVAAEVYGPGFTKAQRQVSKNVNFALVYGAGAAKTAQTAGVSLPEIEHFLSMYHDRFPRVRMFFDKLDEKSRGRIENGKSYVRTWGGRRQVAEADSLYKLRNYLVQGSCADVLKTVIVELDRCGLADHLVLPVHDELIWDVPEEDAEELVEAVRPVMERDDFRCRLACDVDVVDGWGDKYKADEQAPPWEKFL